MSHHSTKGRVESHGVVLPVLFEEVLQSIICKVWIFNYWRNVRAEQKLLYARDRTIFKTSTGVRWQSIEHLWSPGCVHSTNAHESKKMHTALLPALLLQRHLMSYVT